VAVKKLSTPLFTSIIIIAAASISSASTAQVAPPVGVFSGVGVTPAPVNVPNVALDVVPADPSRRQASPGSLVVSLTGPRDPAIRPAHRVTVDISIYSVTPQGAENLVVTAKNVPRAPGAAVVGAPAIHILRFDDKTVFPAPLKPGRYRAEATLTSWTPTASTGGGRPSELVPVEAGGAALNFDMSSLFIAYLSEFTGEIRTMARLVVTDPRQAPAATLAARNTVARHIDAIRAWVARVNAPLPQVPGKAPVLATETSIPAPVVNGISFKLKGQLYTDTAPQLVAQLQAIAAGSNRSMPVPGGILHLYTSLPISVTPAVR
jgi:hypothetical protein